MHEVTITKLSKGYLLSYIKGYELNREAELKESDAFKRAKEILSEDSEQAERI